jgi:hypothetical protein
MAGSDTDDDGGKRTASKKGNKTGRKFTQRTPEFKKLEKLFKSQRISPCDKPSDIRMGNPAFQAFTTVQFRSQYNKLKGIYGTCTRKGEQNSVVVDLCKLFICKSKMSNV